VVWCEAIIAAQTNVNAETDVLAAIAGTSLTTRSGYGRPKITHAAAFTDTNDIARVFVVPSGYADANGFSVEQVSIYSGTTAPDPREWALPIPVEVPENCPLVISATSETAANTAIQVWLMLEYPAAGPFVEPVSSGGLVKRDWENTGALTSNVPQAATVINDLQAGRRYQIIGVGKGAVNGETAGCVGPAYFGLNQKHTAGANWFIPLVNGGPYCTAGSATGWCDFKDCRIKSPIIMGGQPFETRGMSFTAEQPQAVLQLAVDKVFV